MDHFLCGYPAGCFNLAHVSFLQPVLTVMLSEALVDWLKHAFITKFNHIRPSVYERYKDVLCRDLASGSRLSARKHSYVDQSPVVARRLGFASLPLAVLTILIGTQAVMLLASSASPSSAQTLREHVTKATWGPGFSLTFQWWTVEGWRELLTTRLDWELTSHWAKWCIIGFTFWVWCGFWPSFFSVCLRRTNFI